MKNDEQNNKKWGRNVLTEGRRIAAAKGAYTRWKNNILTRTPYGRFLLALENAQKASDSAKSRAANGLRMHDYRDGSRYWRANYRRSRDARELDYKRKSEAVAEACQLAPVAGTTFGWRKDGGGVVPWVVYFELPGIGQASFHSPERGAGPDYSGVWDGLKGSTPGRITKAIKVVLGEDDAAQVRKNSPSEANGDARVVVGREADSSETA